MKTYIVVSIAALCAAIGETFLSFGMRKYESINLTDPSHWITLVLSVVRNPYVFLGVLFLAIFFFLYLAALSWADLSFVLPITATSYLFAAFLAKYFLHEDVTWYRWAGAVVIVVGIALVSLDTRMGFSETRKHSAAGQEVGQHKGETLTDLRNR